jgi:hypothetical protein
VSQVYIFDLDGTLRDCRHRQPLLADENDPDRWRKFYAACTKDTPIHAVIQTFSTLRLCGRAEVWIWSGCSDEVHQQTCAWLHREIFDGRSARWGYPERILRMRPAGDHRPDHELKLEWLNALPRCERNRIVAAFEDRDRVVQMWRANGVPCFQVAEGSF